MNHPDRFIESYVHNGGIGVLVEFGASDSITIRTAEFTRLARDLAIHIAAMAPESVEELMQQPFVKDSDTTVGQQVQSVADELHESIAVLRFVRWVAEAPRPSQPEPPRSPAVILDLRSAG
jgi:elongation factor Ts